MLPRCTLTLACIVLLYFGGCASGTSRAFTSAPGPTISARTRLLSGPVAAIVVGERAVVAIDPKWELPLDNAVAGTLDDGRSVPIEIYWAAPARGDALPGWIADFGLWSATPEERKPKTQNRGVRLLAFSPPTDAIGQGLWIGAKRIDLQWIPSATMLAGEASTHPATQWIPSLSDAQRGSAPLLNLIAPEATNPLTRWRFKLLTEGLAPGLNTQPAMQSASFDDSIIESWARQFEAIWRSTIRKLRMADPAIADAFVRKLTQIMTFPDGRLAPLWPSTDAELLGLAEDLSHDSITPSRAATVIEAWLSAQPAAAAWIHDDAASQGTLGDSPRPVVLSSIGVANLSGKAALATLQAGGPAQLARLESGVATQRLLTTLHQPSPTTGVLPLATIRVLDWEIQRPVASIPVKLTPPGLSIGPLIPDWTMPSLLRSDETSLLSTRPSDIQMMLTFDAGSISGIGPEAQSGWTLIFISLAPPTVAESLQVFLGPSAKPSGTIDLSSEGSLKTTGFGGSCQTLITRFATGWGCQISLPKGIIDSHGFLSLGVSTTRAGVGRASWPRPQFPWQIQPGRVVFDTTTWGELTSVPETQR